MKTWCVILGGLVAVTALAGNSEPTAPAKTPEELGKRTAAALIAGDTNAATLLLPTDEAYMPVSRMNLGEAPATEANLKLVHARWMGRMMEEVTHFRAEFAKATTFNADQIDGIEVTRAQERGRTNWCDVNILFKVKDQKFLLRLDECLHFSNGWYLVDMDWGGKQK